MSEPGFFLQLFPPPQLREGRTGRVLLSAGKPLAVLAYLFLSRSPVTREELAELLWQDAEAGRARASVRQALWVLRKVLGDGSFSSDDPVALRQEWLECDLHLFQNAMEEGDLDTADQLWAGRPFENLEFPRARVWLHWIEEETSRLEQRFGDALAARASLDLEADRVDSAIRWLEKAVEVQPYSTARRAALVDALIRAHRLQEASEILAEARRAVDEEEPAEVFAELEERLASLAKNSSRAIREARITMEFVGRVTEFARLSRQWRHVGMGHRELALILGPPGIGKTRLLQELTALVQSEGGRVVSAKAVAVERSLEWALASDLVRALHALPGAAGISNRSAAVLTRLVPSLAGASSASSPPSAPDATPPVAVADALLDLVYAVAEEAPLMIAVDDLQWADRNSWAALSQLSRASGKIPLFLALTCRTGEADPEVARTLDSLRRTPRALEIELGPLSPSEVSELLVLLIDPLGPAEMDELSAEIYEISRGNPLFIAEILKSLHSQGLLLPNGEGRWRLERGALPRPLPVPQSVESAIRQRLMRLQDPSRLLASYLAHAERPQPLEELGRLLRLDPIEMSRAIEDLFAHDLVRRTRDGRVHLVHDTVAAMARRLFDPPRAVPNGNRIRRWVARWVRETARPVAAVAALALLVLLITPQGRSALGGVLGSPPPTYPYGKGRVLIVVPPEELFWATPPDREGAEWTLTKADSLHFGLPLGRIRGAERTTDGSLRFYALWSPSPADPLAVVRAFPDGRLEPARMGPKDVTFQDLSPDGRHLLLAEADPYSEDYVQQLTLLDLESRRNRVLFRPPEMLRGARWSPDGQKIAVAVRYPHDSLFILTPRGDRIDAYGFDDFPSVAHPQWCSDSDHLVVSVLDAKGVSRAALIRTASHEVSWIPDGLPLRPNSPLLCLGAAAGLLTQPAAYGSESGALFYNLKERLGRELPGLPSGKEASLFWVPDSVPPVISGLEAGERELEVPLGETVRLSARVRLSDGSARPTEASWTALDPETASVDSLGYLTANRVGSGRVVAEFGGWLTDTALVRVRPIALPEVLFRGDIAEGGLKKWGTFGLPEAAVAQVEGAQVISLNGDGRHEDGVYANETFTMPAGATLEVEFRFGLTQAEHQRLQVCLEPMDAPSLARPYGGELPEAFKREGAICTKYPADENIKFDPLAVSLEIPGSPYMETPKLPDALDPDHWVRWAIQIRADGTVSLFVDHAFLYQARARARLREPTTPWRVRLSGASENTHLYVRRVTVWPGERYLKAP